MEDKLTKTTEADMKTPQGQGSSWCSPTTRGWHKEEYDYNADVAYCSSLDAHKVAIITDTHFGCRKGSQLFHNYFQEFYDGTFFHTLWFSVYWYRGPLWGLLWCHERASTTGLLIGQRLISLIHWENGASNSIWLLATMISSTETTSASTLQAQPCWVWQHSSSILDQRQFPLTDSLCFMVPWICDDNAEEFTEQLESTDADVCFGHLELAGFYANQDYKCHHGTDPEIFNKFDRVFSGHFHKKSKKGNITYLGNPYQIVLEWRGRDTRVPPLWSGHTRVGVHCRTHQDVP